MQLSLAFPGYKEEEGGAGAYCLAPYLQTRQDGDIFGLLCHIQHTSSALLQTLLQDDCIPPDLKEIIINHMMDKVDDIEQEMNEQYSTYARQYNNDIRSILRRSFDQTDEADLIARGLHSFNKYNNHYRKIYGGKSFKNVSVIDPDHERHQAYLNRKRTYMHDIIVSIFSLKRAKNTEQMKDECLYLYLCYEKFASKDLVESICTTSIDPHIKNEFLQYLVSKYAKYVIDDIVTFAIPLEDKKTILETLLQDPSIQEPQKEALSVILASLSKE